MLGGILTVQVIQNDITREEVDAITNAANERLMHGGGVAGAIARNGGKAVNDESRAWVEEHGPVPTGSCAHTGPGKLKCRYIIHAVGPMWSNRISKQDNINLLASAIFSTLKKAGELGCASVSMPAISSGIFGFPKPLCGQVFFKVLEAYVK